MTQYSVAIESIKINSTAMPSPYWDQLLLTANLEHHVVGADGKKKILVLATKSAMAGNHGAGQTVDVRALKAADGSPWVFDIPELEPGADLQLRLLINNVRGIPDKDVERLLSQLGLVAAEIAAGALVELPSKVLQVGFDIVLGLAGFGLGELIDEIFADPPKCVGLVFQETISLHRAVLDNYNYDQRLPGSDGWYSDRCVLTLPQSGIRRGEDCGAFSAEVGYAVHRTVQYPPFGTSPKADRAYVEVDSFNFQEIKGNWVDGPSQLNPQPVVWVGISLTGKEWQDGVDITLKEVIVDGGQLTTVAEHKFADQQIVWINCPTPGNNLFGTRKKKNPFIKHDHAVPLSMDKAIQKVTVEPASAAGKVKPQPVGGAAKVSKLDVIGEVPSRLPHVDIAWFVKRTAAIVMPNDITLTFWTEITRVGSQVVRKDLVIRYQREANPIATDTDTWMGRHTPVK